MSSGSMPEHICTACVHVRLRLALVHTLHVVEDEL